MSEDNTGLRDTEIALMDALKVMIEIVLAKDIVTPKFFDLSFTHQRDGYLAKKMPDAAAVMELLRKFATDPERQAYRENLRNFRDAPPQGQA